LCFFFQAEDGIRDRNVTGVQTCALPIFLLSPLIAIGVYLLVKFIKGDNKSSKNNEKAPLQILQSRLVKGEIDETEYEYLKIILRSEERRVGKECKSEMTGNQ